MNTYLFDYVGFIKKKTILRIIADAFWSKILFYDTFNKI